MIFVCYNNIYLMMYVLGNVQYEYKEEQHFRVFELTKSIQSPKNNILKLK